jgi:hypothetical protein
LNESTATAGAERTGGATIRWWDVCGSTVNGFASFEDVPHASSSLALIDRGLCRPSQSSTNHRDDSPTSAPRGAGLSAFIAHRERSGCTSPCFRAALALHALRLVDHFASGIPGDRYNCAGPPREHLACHFLRPRFLCWIVRPNNSFSPDACTVCYLACQFRIDHLSGHDCSSRLMRETPGWGRRKFRRVRLRHGYRHECNLWVAEKGVIRGHNVTVELSNFELSPDAEESMLASWAHGYHKPGKILIVDAKIRFPLRPWARP